MVKGKKTQKKSPSTDHGRGFKRTQKQWENSFCDHVGKIIDNTKATDYMKIAAWAAGSYLIFDTAKKAREIPAVQIASDIASWVEELFLGKSLAPQTEYESDLQWALAAMLGSYVIVEHGGDIAKAIIPF